METEFTKQGNDATAALPKSKYKCILLWSIMYPLSMRTTIYNVFISQISCTWMS